MTVFLYFFLSVGLKIIGFDCQRFYLSDLHDYLLRKKYLSPINPLSQFVWAIFCPSFRTISRPWVCFDFRWFLLSHFQYSFFLNVWQLFMTIFKLCVHVFIQFSVGLYFGCDFCLSFCLVLNKSLQLFALMCTRLPIFVLQIICFKMKLILQEQLQSILVYFIN